MKFLFTNFFFPATWLASCTHHRAPLVTLGGGVNGRLVGMRRKVFRP